MSIPMVHPQQPVSAVYPNLVHIRDLFGLGILQHCEGNDPMDKGSAD